MDDQQSVIIRGNGYFQEITYIAFRVYFNFWHQVIELHVVLLQPATILDYFHTRMQTISCNGARRNGSQRDEGDGRMRDKRLSKPSQIKESEREMRGHTPNMGRITIGSTVGIEALGSPYTEN